MKQINLHFFRRNLLISSYFLVNITIIILFFLWLHPFHVFDEPIYNLILNGSVGLLLQLILWSIMTSKSGVKQLFRQMNVRPLTDQEGLRKEVRIIYEVLEEARQVQWNVPKTIEVGIIDDDYLNAFAIGKTHLVIHRGLWNLDEGEYRAIIAHEVGHLSSYASYLSLLISSSNILIQGITLFFQLIVLFFLFILAFFFPPRKESKEPSILLLMMSKFYEWWSYLGMLLLFDASRQSEYFADDLAVQLGYGSGLVTFLERVFYQEKPQNPKERLFSTHPATSQRLRRIREKLPRMRMEVEYFKFVTPEGVIQSNSTDFVFRYTVDDEYPRIVPFEDMYEIYVNPKTRLEYRAKTLVEAQQIENYLRGVHYNISGCWNAGG